MKRLVRFILLTLGYLVAISKVAARRLSKRSRGSGNSRRRIGMLSGAALALLGLVVAGNLLSPPANAVTIRSGAGSDSCTVEVGNASNASVTKNGDYCIVTVTANTTVTFPAYISQIGIIVVGAGGGGGPDGGTGGAGGEVRYSNAQNVTSGGTVSVNLGAGGAGGSWTAATAASAGGSTTVSGAGISYTANGGAGGGGWQNTVWSSGGTGGSGGSGAAGGSGAIGPISPNANSSVVIGSTGSNGPAVSIGGLGSTYFGGGGGGGSCYNGTNAQSAGVLGAAGGAGGGGRGANYRYNLDDVTYNTMGGTYGHNGTANTGGGGGGGMACDAYASGQNGTYQRTPGGNGSNGVAVMSWQENRTSVSQAPDGCLYNVAEACLQSAKIQLTNAAGASLATSGVTVTLVSTSGGSLGGTLTAVTDSAGVATFNNFWISGSAIGNTPTLTFEAVGYRNVQIVITMKGYAESLNVVSGSTDTAGSFFGTTGIWLATASNSNISATTLQSELTARDVTLRASAASSSTTLGGILWNSGATVTETASSTRTLTLRATRNVYMNGTGRVTSSGQPLNVIVHADSDGTNGGMFGLQGNSTSYPIETNGGSVAIGGGLGTTTWNGLTIPAGYAAGYGLYTSSWWGVELGVNTDIANNKLIATAGGAVRMYGYAWASPSVSALYGVAWESGKIDTGSGSLDIDGQTNGSPSTATNDNWGVGIGVNHGTANDASTLVSSGAVTINGGLTTSGTSNYWGVAIGYADLASGSAGISVTSTSRSVIWAGTTVRSDLTLNGTSASLTGTNTFTGNVLLNATAGDAYVSGTQSLTTSGSTFTAKATANVTTDLSSTVSTNAGNITLWSDTDGGTSRGGGIKTGAGSSLLSTGGAISISGGASNTTSWAKGTSTTDDYGVSLGGTVNAAGGNITIRGEEAASISATALTDRAGVNFNKSSSTTTTGSGTITVDGKADATNTDTAKFHYGVLVGGGDAANLATVTTASGAISIKGDASANSNQWRRGIIMNRATISSGSGAITLDGAGGLNTGLAMLLYGDTNTISSTSGAILLKGNAACGSSFYSGSASSPAGVTLQFSSITVNPGATFTLGGASAKVIESTSSESSFTAPIDLTGMAVSANSTSLRVGKTTNNNAITQGSAWSVAGPISIYGSNINLNANDTVTASGSQFLAKATGDIAAAANVTVQTNGGDLVMWPNSDKVAAVANNTGRFTSSSNLTLRSQGGKIWIAGGLDDGGSDATITTAKGAWSSIAAGDGLPDGYAVGINTSGNTMGVYLGAGYTLSSAGGDIFLAGMDAPTSDTGSSYSMQFVSGLMDSGTGRIGIWAKGYANGTANAGLVLHTTDNTAGSVITSANRTAQAITIYSDTSANTNNSSDGINSWGYAPSGAFGFQSLQLIATGLKDSADLVNTPGGGINVTGIASGAGSTNGAHGIVWQWADALAKDGPITFSGQNTEGSGGYSGAGMYIGAENYSIQAHFGAWHSALSYTNLAGTVTDFASSASNVSLSANKFVFYQPTSTAATSRYYFNTTGDVTLQSVGSTFTSDQNLTHWQFYNIVFGSAPRNVTIGKPTDTSLYNWYSDISATGSIKIYGKYLWITTNTDLITSQAASGTSTRNTGILLKSTERTYLQGTNILQTGGADITLWDDSDGDGLGAMYAEAGLQMKSNGGNITIAGGADDGAAGNSEITGRTAGDGVPDNYSAGYSGWGANGGIDITGGSYQILSNGGDIFLAGRGSATAGDDDYGVLLRGGLMYSNAGKIAIYGKSPASCAANWHRGIGLGWHGDGGTADNIISNSSATDAIKLNGDTTSCNSGGSVAAFAIQDYFSAGTRIVTPNGGGISLIGKQGNASYAAGAWGDSNQESSILELNYTSILSNSGPITLTGARVSGTGNHSVRFNTRGTGQSNSVGAATAAISTGFTAYPTINITASTSDVAVTGDSLVLYQAYFRNTGDLTLQPYAASFDRRQYFSTDWAAYFPATYKNVRIGKAGTDGSNQNSADLDLDRFAATGDISIYGGNINVKNGLTTSETSGNGILVKGTNTLSFVGGSSGANVTTQVTGTNSTAPINIWANADASGEGYIYVNNYNDFTTQGGAINFGGSAAATDTSPSSYAVSNTGSRAGVHLGTSNGTSNANVRITSNGGNIAIRGKGTAGASWGILGWAGFNINSGTGRVLLDGYQTNTGNGIDLEGGASNLGTITSAAVANATPAVSIIGKCDSNNATDAGQRGLYITSGITMSATGGGDLKVAGDNAALQSTNPGSIYIFGADLLSTSGSVLIDGGTDGVVTSLSGYTSNIGATSAGSATGPVTVTGDRINGVGTTNIKTTGNVVLESSSTAFASAMSLSAFNLAAGAANLRVGKSTNDKDVTLGTGAVSVTGDVSVYGSNLTLNGSVTTTATSGNGLLFKAMADIVTGAGTSAARVGFKVTGTNSTAPITFWSNSDASGTGSISIANYTDIASVNGAVTLGGSTSSSDTAPTTYAIGSSSNPTGVKLGSAATAVDCVKITSAAGDISIKGQTNNTASAMGVSFFSGNTVTSTTGAITILGYSNQPTGTNNGHAIYLNQTGGFATTISTGDTSGDAITIAGIVNNALVSQSNNAVGVLAWTTGPLNISATGGGNIAITGQSSTGTTEGGIDLNYANVYAAGGDIKLDTQAQRMDLGYNSGATVFGGSSTSSLAGQISVTSDNLVLGTSSTFQNAAKLSIQSKSANFSTAQAFGTNLVTTNLSGLLVGKTGNTAGVSFSNARTIKGNIDINGGAVTTNGLITTSPSGNLTVIGTGATAITGGATVAGNVSVTGASVTTGAAISSTGVLGINLTATSGSVTTGANLTAGTDTSAPILLKATGDITTGASQTFSTQGGNATFWSDSDANGSGRIGLDSSNSITTLGGKITIAGGADDGASTVASGRTANDGFPDGFAAGNGSTSTCTTVSGTVPGVFLGTTATINSAGGDIFIAGKGLSGTALNCAGGFISNQDLWVKSGNGKVAIYGVANAAAGSTYSSGVTFYGNTSRKTIISSSNSAVDAVVISGNAGPTASIRSSGVFFHGQTAGANVNNIVANTGSGGIQITGRSVPTTTQDLADNVGDGLELYGVAVLAKSGAIALTGTTGASATSNRYGLSMDHSTAGSLTPSQVSIGARAATTVDSVDMSSSTSSVTMNVDSFVVGSATQTKSILTTGTVTIQPADAAQSFDRAIDTTGLTFGSGITGLTIGQSGTSGTVSGGTQNNVDVTVSNAISVAGPISVYGANIYVNNDLTTTSGPVLLKATVNVALGAGSSAAARRTIQTSAGAITLWSNAGANTAGAITLGNYTKLTSSGGAITLAGGATATETSPSGRAKGSGTTTLINGVELGTSAQSNNVDILSGGGDIAIRGYTNVNIAGGLGVKMWQGATVDSGTGAITIDGATDNCSGSNNCHAFEIYGQNLAPTTIQSAKASGTAISISGVTTGTSSDSVGVSTWWGSSTNFHKIQATGGGDISITGSSPSSTAFSVRLNSTYLYAKGNITIDSGAQGISLAGQSATAFATIGGATAAADQTGDIKLKSGNVAYGTGPASFRNAGNLIIEPSGASFSTSQTLPATYFAQTGQSGIRFGKTGNTAALTVASALSAAGPIEIYGGDVTTSANLTATTATGSISINSNGLFTNSAAISSAGGNQPTTVKADKAALTGSITSGTGVTQITGFTSGRTIDMGLSGDTTSTLALTNTELGTITAGTIRVGDSTSGTITVSANITIATAKSNTLALRTAGNVTATNSSIITATNLGISAGGTISLGGLNGVTGNLAIVASGASAGTGVNYGSAGNYTAAAVDSITPVYGIGKNISISSAPAVGSTEVRYLNQTWSAPPVVTVKDEYGYVISANNLNKTSYTTTVAGSGSPTIAGATPVVSGGTQTFSALNFTTATGTTALTFTTSGLATGGTSSVTTGTYDVQGGEPQSIAIAYSATSAPNRKIGFGLTATLKDVNGNTVSGPHATDSITVSVADGDSDPTNNAAIVSGGTPSTVAGVADFSNLKLSGKVSTNYTLTFSVTYLDSGSVSRTKTATQVVTLTPGDAAKLGITTQAAGFANRSNFTTQPVVAIQDADGNTVTTATDTVAVAVTAASGTSTQGLTGTTSVAAVNGVATFAGLGKTGLIGDKTLTFTSGALTSATQNFTLSFGAANKLAMTSPATTVNDTVFGTQPIVTIQDQDGNTVADATTRVTLTSDATIGGTLLSSAVAMDAVSGVANFSGKNVKLTGTVGAKSLTATITGGITVSNSVTITYGAATKLSITRQAAGAVNGVNFTTQPQVTVQDVSGNTVANSSAAITVASSGATLAGTATVNATSGVATFAGLNLTGTVNSYTLTFTSSALTSDQQSIALTYGAAHHLALTTAAAGAVNGVAFTTQPVITIQDQSNNTVANLNSTVTVASSGSVLSSNNSVLTVNAVNGVATFANALKLTGAAATYTLTFSISAPSALNTTQSITVTPGAATQLALTTQAAGFVNRTDFTTAPAVSIKDASGNVVTSATDSITVSIDSGNLTGTTTVAAVNGVATFTGLGKNGTIGSKTLTFHTGTLTDATQTFTLTFGAAYQLAKSTPAAGFTNDVAFTTQPKITIQDQDGNTVADSTATVTVTASGATLGGTTSMAAVAGVANFSGKGIKLTGTVGDYTLSYAIAGPITATQPITLTYGSADHLSLTTQAAGAVNRVAFTTQPVVEVRDVSNNLVANSTLQITAASSTGATIGGTASRSAVAGVADFGLNSVKTQLYGAVGSYTITYSATAVTAATQSLTLTFGAATKLAMISPATAVNDTVFGVQPIVTIQDQDGNTVADSTAPVILTSSDATIGGTLQGGAVAMNAVAGVANFAGKNVKLTGTIGARNLTAEASGLTSVTNQVTITYGVASKLALTTQPTGFVNRTNFTVQPVVTVQDISGNTVANSTISIDASIDSGALTGTTRINAVNGVATFAGLGKTGTIGNKTLTFADTAGLLTVATKQFTLTHGAAHHLSMAVASTLVNDTAFSTQPVVTIFDQDDNVVTSGAQSTQTVTISATGATSVSIGGTVTMAAVAGVADFSGKGIKLTGLVGAKSLTATISSPSSITKSENVTVTYGSADHLSLATSAAGAANGAAFTTQPVVEVRDVSENVVANSTAQVAASVSNGTLSGTTTLNAAAGVATFTNLGLTATAGTKVLTFASANLTSATQNILAVTGAPSQLRIDVAGTLVNNTAFATQPVVTLLDATNTVVSAGAYATQTVTLSSPDATIAGTLTMQSVAGVADFAGKGIKLTGIAGAHNLRASISSPSTITQTVPVTITFGAAHHLNIASAASGAANRLAFANQPAIEVLDVSGNRVTDSTASISVTASGANGAVLGGDTAMNAVAGIAYYNQNANPLKLTGRVGSYTLAYASTGLTGASEAIALTHGVASQIVLAQSATGAKSGQAFTTQPRLEVRDADGNLVDTGTASTAEIKVSTGAAAYDAATHTGANLTGPASSDVVTAAAGVATFAGLRLEGVAASAYGLTFTTQNTAGYNGLTTSQSIALTAGIQTHLAVVQQPTAIIAGAAFSPAVSVELLDAWNNRVLDVANTVTVKPSLVDDALASNTLDSTKAAVANASGLVTFTGLTFTKAGTQFIQFTSAGLVAATSSSFVITNAQAHHLVWVTSPVGAKNDYAIKGAAGADPELEIRDQYENPVLTGAATTVAVSEPSANTSVISISGGSARNTVGSARVTFSNLVLRAKVGSYTLRFTAANGTLPINATHIDSSAAVAITFGDPAALRLTRAAAGANSGAPFATQPRLNIEDTAGNVVADSTLPVTVSENETQVLSGTQTKDAVAGSVDFTDSGLKLSGAVQTGLTLKYSVSYNSSEISTTQQIDLNPGLAVDLTIAQQPTTVRTRVAFSPVPTVVLRDASGNRVTTDSTSTVTAQLKDSNGNPVGNETAAFTASGGMVTFTGLAFQAPSTTNYYVTFKLTSNGQAVTSNAFDILPGVATELRITDQPSTLTADQTPGKTGELLSTQPVVKLYDQDGNLVTTANSGAVTIRVKSTDGAGSLSEGSTSATVVGGIATFTGVKFVGTPGVSYTLDFATSTPNPVLTSAASTPISVIHNDATHLVVTRSAANGRSGLLFGVQPIITVKDRYENTVTSGPDSGVDIAATGEITAPVSGVSNPSNDTATAINGVATFQALGLTGLVSNTYKLNFNIIGSNTVAGVSQSNVTLSYGSANHLTITTQPVGGNATGQHLATQPVVEVRDGAGNKVANSTLTVTASIISTDGLVLADNSAARLAGATKAAVAGVATFDALDLYGLPGTDYTLKFAVTGIGFATSNSIQVTHAVAHHLTITQQPAGGNATGSNLAGQPTVQLRDQFENLVTANSASVITARLSSTSARERLEGSSSVALAQGVGAFAGLKVVALPDTDYTLDFSTTIGGTTFTSVASNSFRVTYSTPTKLTVVQQPSGGTTGVALNTQPIVEVQDVYGNRVYNYVGNVTASVAAGATLTNSTASDSSLSTAVAAGRATFAGLALTGTPATDYQLTFASGALTSVNSVNIRVIPGAPVRIVVLNQPIGAETGAALAGQPVVEVQDSFGNRVTQENSTVITATLTSGLGGTLTRVVSSNSVAITATTVNGVATFSNLYMRGLTNHNYRMTFSSGQLAVAESADYTVHHAAVSSLVWATQPTVGMTGSPLTRAAVLELQDLDGNVADTDNSTVVTATITSGVGGSIVNRSATARNGVVTFANLTLTGTPGVAYKLTFTGVIGATVVSAPESNALTPTHAVPAKLTMQGGNVTGGLSGQDLTSQPTLYVRDRFNNIATSDNSTVVTASILDDLTGSVSGNVTATAVNGVVTFAGLKAAGTPGTPYALNFAGNWSGTTLTSTASNTFTMSKVADVSLAYTAQDYVPNARVLAQFNTDSPGDITFSTNASSLVCVLDPGTGDLIIKGVGNCLVRVDVDTDLDGFYLANHAEATLVISKARQAPISFTSASTVDYWSSLNPTAIGGTGTGSLSYSVVAGSTCRLIGATILPGEAGSLCQVTATRAGDANYLAETSPVQTIVVRKINQAPLSIASAPSMSVDNLTLFTAGGSGTGAVTYSIVSSGTAHCRIAGDLLSATAAGTCSVRATKAASTNYNAITSATQTISVTKEDQTVAFTSTAPMYPVVGGSYTPTAAATSTLAVTYSIATSSSGVACAFDSAVPTKINFTATGVCEVVATQAGSSRYAAASVRQIIRVGLLNQTIAFDVIPDLAYGTPAFKLLPTTNAGSSAVITLATTSNSTACTLAGNIVTLNQAGYCEIAANQAGYGSYAAATEVIRGFNVLADFAGAPHIFSTSVTTHALTASFTAPSYTGGAPITGYVLVATDANGVSYENAACPVGGSSITCTIVGLPNDIAYTAVARAITSAGRGTVSNVTVAQTPMDAPMAVTNLATSAVNNNLVVTWAPPTALDGTFVRYDIFVAPIGSSFPATTPYSVTDVNATSATIANILNQAVASPSPTPSPSTTTASARVAFRRASVSSPSPSPSASNTAPVFTSSAGGYKVLIATITTSSNVAADWNTSSAMQTNFAVPLSPSQLTLTVTGSDLMASWSAPTADGGSAVTGYDVKVNGAVVCAATTSLFCAVNGMQPGQTYSVEVFAINSVGLSAASAASHSVAALPVSPGNANGSNGLTVLSTSAKTVSTKGGQLLTLLTRNFAGVTDALLDGKQLKIVSNSEDHITLEMPAHAAGLVDLTFKSKLGTLVFQDAVRFVAPPRADLVQKFSRYRVTSVAANAKMVTSIKAVLTAEDAPKAMICVGLVPAKYTAADIRAAKLRAQNACEIGAKLDGNLAVRATTEVTKLIGPAARAVKVTYKY